ncbi:carbamoyltransferase C-terminal domain-containing protein [Streptomyces sp. NPDC004270]
MRKATPAVVHRDGPARLQAVLQTDSKPLLLLNDLKSLTDVPIALNTPLNRRGMPIVETPPQALSLLWETALDALVSDGFVVRRVPPERQVQSSAVQ